MMIIEQVFFDKITFPVGNQTDNLIVSLRILFKF